MSELCWNRGWCELVCLRMSVEIVDCVRVSDHDVECRRDPGVHDVSLSVTVNDGVDVAEAMMLLDS